MTRISKKRELEDKKIKKLQKFFLSWYAKNGRHFPWRNKSITNYQAVIAEVLLYPTGEPRSILIG